MCIRPSTSNHQLRISARLGLNWIYLILILAVAICSCREENRSPTCQITQPQENTVFRLGDVFDIAVGASDPDGEIAEVRVYINKQELARRTNPPYIFNVDTEITGSGSYSIRAVARDDGDLEARDEIEVRVDAIQLPLVQTNRIEALSSVSVEGYGNISSDGGSPITERGMCWNKEGNPTLADSYKATGAGSGPYKVTIVDLDCNTTYFLRAYGINSLGTAYGDPLSFTTANLPAVSTSPIHSMTATTAQSGGTIADPCGRTILAKGVCWSTSSQPDIEDFHSDEGGGPEAFNSQITGLEAGAYYYVRAYITVSEGTVYGEEIRFRTWDNSPINDVDGNAYNTVLIGDQIWMAENLRVTRYADGSPIPKVEGSEGWDTLSRFSKAYCWYDDDSIVNAIEYGALYTFPAALRGEGLDPNEFSILQGACPEGWHIPNNREWNSLFEYLGGEEVAGGKLKEEGSAHWQNPNRGASNESGFRALPAGYRETTGRFYNLGLATYFHSANKCDYLRAYIHWLYFDYEDIRELCFFSGTGYSVRCLKD